MYKDSTGNILLIDDEEAILKPLSMQLDLWGYKNEKVTSGREALNKITETEYDLIFLDANLGDMSGFDVLEEVQKTRELTPVIMISGLNQSKYLRSAIRKGAFDYIVKPWGITDLKDTITKALERRQFLVNKEQAHINLEKEVENKTIELSRALEQINITYDETILALGSALETRDSETKEHGLRVAYYSLILASKMKLNDYSFVTNLQRGAYLHDIGKIGVPDQILRKNGSLTVDEWQIMKKHPAIGKSIVEGIPFLRKAVSIIYNHHENYDGSGYPQGLKGDEIPIEARIFSVSDALDALTSDRCYRNKISSKNAMGIIISDSGKQFSPEVVNALMGLSEDELSNREIIYGC